MSDLFKPLEPGLPGDRRMIQNPDLWPMYPRLPMKRPTVGGMACGVIVDHPKLDPARPSVFDVTMFDGINVTSTMCFRYDSIDDMQEDGWVVD